MFGARSLSAAVAAIWVIGSLAMLGCPASDSGEPIDANVIGTVLLDEDAVQGVGVRIVDENDGRQTTSTDVQGEYRFEVLPGEVTVSLISGLPNDVSCAPNTTQDATAPPLGDPPVEVDFVCETLRGAGGAGGGGGAGGAGGGGCGSPANSQDADLAGDITVFVNGEDVTGEFPPALVAESDVIRVDVPVTAGTRFVNVTYADTSRSETIGSFGSVSIGDETLTLEFVAFGGGQFPEGTFPLIIILENEGGTRNVVYETDLPDCNSVTKFVETMGTFDEGNPAFGCTPSCLLSPVMN